jgi:hypothetical protein
VLCNLVTAATSMAMIVIGPAIAVATTIATAMLATTTTSLARIVIGPTMEAFASRSLGPWPLCPDSVCHDRDHLAGRGEGYCQHWDCGCDVEG